ncbi:spore coat U domain-containing protein [Ancylothrix sp. C2]|uniref:Csu type fimbrial protein n=1 Tax=Ancylothrix sp. D3o TaxID=2953691 RepID=UPI0021BAB1BB|nr:spore coat U domain-containing protein [Ancylothrix sp. D3o]MCT7951351.1 spore coat U domain-containing protein [Ancylothrix sp. D3o]
MKLKEILVFAGVVITTNLAATLPGFAQNPNRSCTITPSPLNFGFYDVFSTTPLTASSSLQIACTSPGNSTVQSVTTSLTRGNAPTFNPRQMRNNANESLNYNIFTDASRTIIWGDGTNGTTTIVRNNVLTVTLPIQGAIPAGQNVRAGTYTDIINITINF